jgi:SHS2 domain-containing protein
MERWEHYREGADIGVRGFGDTEADAFEQAALALTAAIADPASVLPLQCVAIRCEAPSRERLLAQWLDAVASSSAVSKRMLFSRFEVRLDGQRLSAQAWGEPLDPERHHPRIRVKRATEKTLRVARHGEGWMAQTLMEV